MLRVGGRGSHRAGLHCVSGSCAPDSQDVGSPCTPFSWCLTTGGPKPPALPNALSIAAAPANAGTSVLVTDGVSLYWTAATPAGGTIIERVAST